MNDKEIKELFTINKEVNYEKALKYVCDEYNKLEVKLVERNLNLQSNWNSLRECIKNEIKKLLDIMDKDKIEGFELTVFQNAINRYKFVLDKMNELEKSDIIE